MRIKSNHDIGLLSSHANRVYEPIFCASHTRITHNRLHTFFFGFAILYKDKMNKGANGNEHALNYNKNKIIELFTK